MTKMIAVKVVVEGTHNWDTCNLSEVNYLASEHRHLFYVYAKMYVSHSDRDREFIQLKHDIQEYMFNTYFDETKRLHRFGSKSCEMLAEEIAIVFGLDVCGVYEDDENGAEVYRD